MSNQNFEGWLDQTLPLYSRLTESVVSIIENLLRSNDIDYLAVSGRTKTKKSVLEKVDRKGYRNPREQLTDLSGIRIIVFFESSITEVSDLINRAFLVDQENSLNQDSLLSADQIGYRSVHFVCDLGSERASLPEFQGLAGFKFEFQVRTVLQHAWAELAHDRKYKFSGRLPKRVERQLYLYAGMLEIADQGFDEVSKSIDRYIADIEQKSSKGDLDVDIDSISIESFVQEWASKNDIEIEKVKGPVDELIGELNLFGVHKIKDITEIIPNGYSEVCKKSGRKTTIFGLIRDWMLIHDWRRFLQDVPHDWVIIKDDDKHVFNHFIPKDELAYFYQAFEL